MHCEILLALTIDLWRDFYSDYIEDLRFSYRIFESWYKILYRYADFDLDLLLFKVFGSNVHS